MTGNSIGLVICRVAAVWLFVSGLGGVVLGISSLLIDGGAINSLLVYSAVVSLGSLIAAFILWHYAENISATRFGTSGISIGDPVDSSDLVSIGMLLLGIYILVTSIASAFQVETMAWLQSNMFQDRESIAESISARRTSDRVAYSVRMVIAVALVLRGKAGLR